MSVSDFFGHLPQEVKNTHVVFTLQELFFAAFEDCERKTKQDLAKKRTTNLTPDSPLPHRYNSMEQRLGGAMVRAVAFYFIKFLLLNLFIKF